MSQPDGEIPYYTITKADDGLVRVQVNAPEISVYAKGPFSELADQVVAIPGPKRVVLNLGPVRAINSAAIASLIQLQKKIREAQGRLKLCEVDPYVKNILSMTKVDQLLEIHKTEGEAIAAFNAKGNAPGGEGQGGFFSKLFGGK